MSAMFDPINKRKPTSTTIVKRYISRSVRRAMISASFLPLSTWVMVVLCWSPPTWLNVLLFASTGGRRLVISEVEVQRLHSMLPWTEAPVSVKKSNILNCTNMLDTSKNDGGTQN